MYTLIDLWKKSNKTFIELSDLLIWMGIFNENTYTNSIDKIKGIKGSVGSPGIDFKLDSNNDFDMKL